MELHRQLCAVLNEELVHILKPSATFYENIAVNNFRHVVH